MSELRTTESGSGRGLRLLQSTPFVWLACLALVVLWDQLFWGWPVGVSVAVFAGVVGLILVARSPGLFRTGQGWFIVAALLVTILALVEEPSTLAVAMTFVAVGTLVLISQRDLSLLQDTATAWLGRWLTLLSMLWVKIIRDNVLVARWLARHPQAAGRIVPILRAVAWWVIPLFVGAVFVVLFAVANPVISLFFSHVWDHAQSTFLWLAKLSIVRVLWWGLVIVLAYGLLRHRHTWRARVAVPPVVAGSSSWEWLTGPQMIVRLLIVMNLVFVIANALDAAYLYFGVPLPEHMGYREYAHRGAYTLIVTALLAGAMTLVAFRQGGTAQRSRVCRWLVYLWIGQNVLLLVSTIWRVWMFVQVTELTRLRISTMVWCGLVAAGFVWIIVRIMTSRPNAWLWRMNAFTALATLLVCSFINFDGIVAQYNVRHCAQSGGPGFGLDVGYLKHLGPRSLPALVWMRGHPGTMTAEERDHLLGLEIELRRELQQDFEDWRGWTYRRWRSYGGVSPEAVAKLREDLRPELITANRDGQ